MLLNFIWKNRFHYLKKSVLMNSYEKGGLNFLDFTTLNNTFKINWIKSYLKNPLSIWNIFPHHMFAKVGGFHFLLLCHYNIDKIPVKLSAFHRQTLRSWALIYKHNFSPHKFFIWNNRYILYKNNSLFYNNWFDNNILLVGQLFNHNGQLLRYEEFNLKYNLAVPPKEYAIVFDAVTNEICELFINTVLDANIPFISLSDTTIGKSCFNCARKNNKIIRVSAKCYFCSSAVFYWRKFIPDLPWKNVWTLHQKLLINNMMRDVSFKLLHRIYPTNQYMLRYKKTIDPNCTFCKEHPETISHLFWNCNTTKKLWKDCARFINYKLDSQYQIKFEHIIFGLHEKNIRSNVKLAINLIIIFGKFHIHKSKFSSSQLFFPLIIKELESYLHTISNSLKKKPGEASNAAILAAIESLKSMMTDFKSELQQNTLTISAIAKAVEFNSAEIKECKDKNKKLEEEVKHLKEKNVELEQRTSEMEKKTLESERYKRRWNLRLNGVKEEKGEDTRGIVADIITKIAPPWTEKVDNILDTVHRLGPTDVNRPRQIIIQFTGRRYRDELWRMTKHHPVCRDLNIRFAEDLIKEDREARKAVWPKVEQARKNGCKTMFRGPYAFINGQRVTP
ncbi:uncharacterized protein LOC111947633 [Oryzias latipes]|uniref:uncharacterized protein LOC111947633 n=1 Tax=Oryzias latipes TaxID=8090 RepID=UPI000CE16AFF|nr:uncharacterized protein LOC111947633 [Oryzias latipes]